MNEIKCINSLSQKAHLATCFETKIVANNIFSHLKPIAKWGFYINETSNQATILSFDRTNIKDLFNDQNNALSLKMEPLSPSYE